MKVFVTDKKNKCGCLRFSFKQKNHTATHHLSNGDASFLSTTEYFHPPLIFVRLCYSSSKAKYRIYPCIVRVLPYFSAKKRVALYTGNYCWRDLKKITHFPWLVTLYTGIFLSEGVKIHARIFRDRNYILIRFIHYIW